MGHTTTYRVRWTASLEDLQMVQAMLPAAGLPLSRARPYDDICEDVSLVAPGVSIAGLVPAETIPEPACWTFNGKDLVFTADLLNPQYRHDDSTFAEIGEPSRERVLLDALTATCGAPDGTIVGAWTSDHSDHWHPVVFVGGRVARSFVECRPGYKADGAIQHDGRLPDGLTVHQDGTVTIPAEALA